jgi:catechol 2,3-dioxygenase-like lactoylglutathione lyase family enzyme
MANQETKTPRVKGVGHVALNARDPAALAKFYREVLGFQVVPTETSDLGENVSLSSHPAEVSVDLALFRNRA